MAKDEFEVGDWVELIIRDEHRQQNGYSVIGPVVELNYGGVKGRYLVKSTFLGDRKTMPWVWWFPDPNMWESVEKLIKPLDNGLDE
jgi:hypothetical protein